MNSEFNEMARKARDNAEFYVTEGNNPTLTGKSEIDWQLELLFTATAKTCEILRRMSMSHKQREQYLTTKLHTVLTVPDTSEKATDLRTTGTEFFHAVNFTKQVQENAETKEIFDAAALFLNALIVESDDLADFSPLSAVGCENPVRMCVKSLEAMCAWVTYTGKTEYTE